MIFSKAKGQSRGFIFTKRTQSEKGIFATVLAIMSLVSIIINIYFSYKNAGDVSVNIGVAGFLALSFMRLTLGRDIGIVMAKGVLLGIITVITILPSLILVSD